MSTQTNKFFYLVTSPMQLINAYEYKMQFEGSGYEHHLRIFSHLPARRKVFEESLELMQWDKISLSFSSANIGLSGGIMFLVNFVVELIFQFNFRLFRQHWYSRIVFGHYITFVQRGYMKSYSGKLILVDDGNFSFHVSKFREHEKMGNDVVSAQAVDKVNKLVRPWFNYSLKSKKIEFFTHYPVKVSAPDIIRRNDYEKWKEKMEKTVINEESIWIIGGDYVENGWMLEDDYLNFIYQISEKYTGKELIYIKKWSESKTKLDKLPTQVAVQEFNLPLEIVILKSVQKPAYVFGFISSVLFNISGLFNDKIQFYMIDVPLNSLSPTGADYFRRIYDQKSNFPIKIFD